MSLSAPDHNVFVYGSLLFDEVVEGITGRLFPNNPAWLGDHARYSIDQAGRIAKGPAIIHQPGGTVEGRLLRDLDPECLRVLDRFELGDGENPNYERVSVSVTLAEGVVVPAQTYRAVDSLRPFLAGEWSVENFRTRHLEFYAKKWLPELRRQWGLDS